ncbi:hypothetical protein Aura_00094 [Pseudomonas phage vB_PpuM-Aura]
MSDTQDPNGSQEPEQGIATKNYSVAISTTVDVSTETNSNTSFMSETQRLFIQTDANFFAVETVARNMVGVPTDEIAQVIIDQLKEYEDVTVVNVSFE